MPGFDSKLQFIRTYGVRFWKRPAGDSVFAGIHGAHRLPAVRAGADPATGGRAARTRTQQGSGPGWEPRCRPRAGAGAGAGVPAAIRCSSAGRRRDPAAGPPASPVPPQPPNAAARSSAGGRRSKVTKMGFISCLLIFCSGSALSREALTVQAAAFWGTLWFF